MRGEEEEVGEETTVGDDESEKPYRASRLRGREVKVQIIGHGRCGLCECV